MYWYHGPNNDWGVAAKDMSWDLVCALLLFIGNVGHLGVLSYKVLKFTELEVWIFPSTVLVPCTGSLRFNLSHCISLCCSRLLSSDRLLMCSFSEASRDGGQQSCVIAPR